MAAAGWRWAALLIAYFVTSAFLTRLGRERKVARTDSVLPSHGERGAVQVAANGGIFALAVLAGELADAPSLLVAGLGAIAASAADTWATEIGALWGGTPRSILTGRPMSAGISGGITAVGVAASALAAALVAAASHLFVPELFVPEETLATAVFVAGMTGTLGDSVLGATVQSKRWCEQCLTWTERRVHTCQYRSQHARGIRWITNDTVNFLATLVGALVALAAAGPIA